jgi:hypothetical protein
MSATENIDSVIAKINKLRELAGHRNDNPNEAASAAAAAAILIDKFQLSEADLIIKGQQNAEPIEIIREALHESGRVMQWIKELTQVLCDHYGCTWYINTEFNPSKVFEKTQSKKRGTIKQFICVGRKSDFEIIKYFFTWLKETINDLIVANARGMGMEYSQNYGCGCVNGIRFQLANEHNKLKEEAARLNQSTAMVVLDKRAVEAEAFLRATIKLGKAPSSKLGRNLDAFVQGTKRGKNIQLKTGLGSGNNSPNKFR